MPPKREYDDARAVGTPAVSADDDQMTTFSLHSFGDSDDDNHGFSIQIIENMREEYGMFVWPCSVVLAEYVWQQRSRFSGTSVIELGAGTSLPGLVAAKVGADVTLTDESKRVEVGGLILFVLENIRSVCDLNKLSCKVMGLTWGIWDAQIFDLHPQILLGADVLYDTSAFDDLFSTVAFLLQSNPGSVFITTYHNRSGHHLIEFLMVKWGLKCIKLLDAFSFMPSGKASGLGGNIQLAEIVLVG
ncbi:Methyltransferase-like protein 23 [Bienertia sinuspersici]